MPKVIIGITRWYEILGRNYGIEEPYWGPSPLHAKYRIYSINRPGRFLNVLTLRVGAYSRWAHFTIFSKCSMSILQQKSKW